MSSYDLVLRGRVVTPEAVLDRGWIAVSGETIAAVGTGEPPAAARVDDFGDAWLLPGVIDGQTHACSYGGLPGIESTTRGALAGGVTTLVDMPYDNPDPLNSAARLAAKVETIETVAYADMALYGTILPGQSAEDVAELAEGGVCALKISWFESHPQRFPRIPADQTLDIFAAAARFELPLGVHNEDQEIVRARIARFKAEGKIGPEWHEPSRPEAAELAATAAFLELGAAAGAHAHIVHFSTPRGFDMVLGYREQGHAATGELCVHYLMLDAEHDTARLGARMKVSPPIRAGQIEALWQSLFDGKVAFVSSDHSSWPVTNKSTPSIFDAGAGIPGLQTLLPGFYSGLVPRVTDPAETTALFLSERPAKFFGLWPRKGRIGPGADADIAVLAPGDWVYDAAADGRDGLNWSPFDGDTFAARVTATYVRGRKAFADGEILGRPGDGRYIRRIGVSEY